MMTKPELLMYCMAYQSKCMCQLTYADREDFIRRKLFKDFKAISNALYPLKKNGYVAMLGDGSWFLTKEGVNYLAEVIKRENSSKASNEPEHHCSKPEEWNDDLDFTDEYKEKIARLEEENKKLRIAVKTINEFYEKLKAYSSDQSRYIGELIEKNTELKNALHALHDKYAPFKKSIEAFTAGAKIFSDIANGFMR